MTESTKSSIASQKPAKIESNAEMKELMRDIEISSIDTEAVSEFCQEFGKHSISLPYWTRGFNEIIPLVKSNPVSNSVDALSDQFEKLKLRYRRARWI